MGRGSKATVNDEAWKCLHKMKELANNDMSEGEWGSLCNEFFFHIKKANYPEDRILDSKEQARRTATNKCVRMGARVLLDNLPDLKRQVVLPWDYDVADLERMGHGRTQLALRWIKSQGHTQSGAWTKPAAV